MLKELKLSHVGPAPSMELEFGERLNLITGDNGLGKSFLLDIAWWSMTRVGIPTAAAVFKPAASGRLESTAATRTGREPSAAAASSDCMLLPRPEIRITMDFILDFIRLTTTRREERPPSLCSGSGA